MEFIFYPLKQFEWVRISESGQEELIGNYIPGNKYNCTKESKHDPLRLQCEEWALKGLIRIEPLVNQHFTTLEL